MRERFRQIAGTNPLHRPFLFAVGATVGFVAIIGSQLQPPDPESRLPGSQRLAALIQRTQEENNGRKVQVQQLQSQIDGIRNSEAKVQAGTAQDNQQLATAGLFAGTTAMSGDGFTVSLNDSTLDVAPTGNVNDLVIHSHDVQAVVNGVWSAGAEAVSVNGERVVSTSAVLCVGNTLLINGAVFSPPYEVSAVGADRDLFNANPMVKDLRDDAERFSLRFSVSRIQPITVPGYSGPTAPKYAKVVSAG